MTEKDSLQNLNIGDEYHLPGDQDPAETRMMTPEEEDEMRMEFLSSGTLPPKARKSETPHSSTPNPTTANEDPTNPMAEDYDMDAIFDKITTMVDSEVQGSKTTNGSAATSKEPAPTTAPTMTPSKASIQTIDHIASAPAISPGIPPKRLRTLLLHEFKFDSIVISIPYDEEGVDDLLLMLQELCCAENLRMDLDSDERYRQFDIVIEKQHGAKYDKQMAVENALLLLDLVSRGYCTLFAETVE